MPIIIERKLRECDHNKNLRADGNTHGLIYDHFVYIDGEHRATFKRSLHTVGFYLQDTNHRPIHEDIGTGAYRRHTVDGVVTKNFVPTIERLLAANEIPTIAEADFAAIHDAAWKDNAGFDERIKSIRRAKENAAEQMFDALKLLVDGLFIRGDTAHDIAYRALAAATYKPTPGDDDV